MWKITMVNFILFREMANETDGYFIFRGRYHFFCAFFLERAAKFNTIHTVFVQFSGNSRAFVDTCDADDLCRAAVDHPAVFFAVVITFDDESKFQKKQLLSF